MLHREVLWKGNLGIPNHPHTKGWLCSCCRLGVLHSEVWLDEGAVVVGVGCEVGSEPWQVGSHRLGEQESRYHRYSVGGQGSDQQGRNVGGQGCSHIRGQQGSLDRGTWGHSEGGSCVVEGGLVQLLLLTLPETMSKFKGILDKIFFKFSQTH